MSSRVNKVISHIEYLMTAIEDKSLEIESLEWGTPEARDKREDRELMMIDLRFKIDQLKEEIELDDLPY